MRVMTILGTRPEMIKLWSTINKLDSLNFDHVLVHTGQNYTPELKDFFFRDLKLRQPDYQLQIDTSSYGREVADVVRQSDELLGKVKPDALIILGDTYSGLACMPASYRGVRILHMEAGLRAWDCRMPEQRNRILIDHMSDALLPFYPYHRENLLRENIHPSKIFLTGNPTFEVIRAFKNEIEQCDVLQRLSVSAREYILVTAHRSENVDNPKYLMAIMNALNELNHRLGKEILYPMHPRTQSKIGSLGFKAREGVKIMNPLGFYDFNKLFQNAFCVMSDSGTAPEESYYYKVPCVSLRMATERQETVEGGAHIVAGMELENIVESVVTATSQEWGGRYNLEENWSPSTVVVNVLRSQITNHFQRVAPNGPT